MSETKEVRYPRRWKIIGDHSETYWEQYSPTGRLWHHVGGKLHSRAHIHDVTRRKDVVEVCGCNHRADAVSLIAAERERQKSKEGWSAKHDADHVHDELAIAAACYALPDRAREIICDTIPICGGGSFTQPGVRYVTGTERPRLWPWERRWWKPTPDDRIRELAKAGALIAAEIDRLLAKPQHPAAAAEKDVDAQLDDLSRRLQNTGHLAIDPPQEWIADRTFADDERVTPVVERDDESPYWLAGALKPDVSVVPSANYDALKLELAGIREEDERLTQLYANVMIQNEALQAEIVALRQQLTAAESALAEANERKSLNERIGGDFMGIIELAMNTECFGNTPEEKTDKLLTEWMLIRRERDDLKQANAALAKEVERLKGVVEESEHVSKILACENRVLIGASNEGACRSLRHGSPLVLLWILETEKLRLIEKVEEQTSLASAALADAKGVG
jgi:hypothetical protein